MFAAAGERYYKVAAEALRVCEQLVRIIRPDPTQPLQAGLQVRASRLFLLHCQIIVLLQELLQVSP